MSFTIFTPIKLAATISRSSFIASGLLVSSLVAPSFCLADSLADIYQLAQQNDAGFKTAEATLQAGKLNSTIGRSALLPQINANMGYTQSNNTINPKQGNEFDRDSNTTSYGASLDQPLFNAAAWYNYQRSKVSVNISEAQFALSQQSLIVRTASAYFACLKAVDDLTTAQAEENALAHSLEQTKQRFEVGLTAITEVHEAQAEFDSAYANRLIKEGDLTIAFDALQVLTGQAHHQLAPLKNQFPVTATVPADRLSWEKTTLEHNLELQSAKFELAAAEANYKAKRSGHLPTLSANVGYNNVKTDVPESAFPSAGELGDNTSTGTSASIRLNMPLFSGGRTSGERQQAAYQKVAQQENVNFVERQKLQETRSLHQLVNTGVATVKARKQAIISNESALEATKAGYEVGTRNLVNVLDAQRKVYEAKRNYLSTLYDYVLSSLKLKQSAGTLNISDITQLDQWLNKEQLVGLSAKQ